MGRKILAVICSYAAIAILFMILLMVGTIALGVDRTYEPGSYRTSSLWGVTSLLLGTASGVAGGWMCRRIAGSTAPVYWLVGLIVVLGALHITGMMSTPMADAVRPPDVELAEAMNQAIRPMWVLFLNPVVGVVGVLIGARAAAPKDSSGQTPLPSPH